MPVIHGELRSPGSGADIYLVVTVGLPIFSKVEDALERLRSETVIEEERGDAQRIFP
jgi:hypothetical protein